MKRAVMALVGITAFFAVVLALSIPSAAAAQPKSLTQHQKLDRLDAKLDQVLELLRAAPAKPPVATPPPVEPKPAEPPPAPPAGMNPRIAELCAQGLTLYELMLKLQVGVSAAETEFAYASGCRRAAAPPVAAPGEPGGVNPAGFDLAEGGGTVLMHDYAAGQARTFTFTVRPGGQPALSFFGASGSYFHEVTDTGPGFTNRKTRPTGSLKRHQAITPADGLAPGRYAYTVAPDTAGRFGMQFHQ